MEEIGKIHKRKVKKDKSGAPSGKSGSGALGKAGKKARSSILSLIFVKILPILVILFAIITFMSGRINQKEFFLNLFKGTHEITKEIAESTEKESENPTLLDINENGVYIKK